MRMFTKEFKDIFLKDFADEKEYDKWNRCNLILKNELDRKTQLPEFDCFVNFFDKLYEDFIEY